MNRPTDYIKTPTPEEKGRIKMAMAGVFMVGAAALAGCVGTTEADVNVPDTTPTPTTISTVSQDRLVWDIAEEVVARGAAGDIRNYVDEAYVMSPDLADNVQNPGDEVVMPDPTQTEKQNLADQ